MKQEIKAEVSQTDNWKALSKRPQQSHMKNFLKNKLVSNLYSINFDKNIVIAIYSVKLNPNILYDSRKKANQIIESARKGLQSFIGSKGLL